MLGEKIGCIIKLYSRLSLNRGMKIFCRAVWCKPSCMAAAKEVKEFLGLQVSQRMWKVPGDRAASLLQDTARTTWSQKMEKKLNKREFKEILQQSRATYGAKQKVCS